MSLVLLSHLCSHLQNASLARLGLTSVPHTSQHHSILLALQRSGYVSTVTIAGPRPPAPSALSPTLSPLGAEGGNNAWSEVWSQEGGEDAVALLREAQSGSAEEGEEAEGVQAAVTQANVASRRLWVGLKYWNNEPVLRGVKMVSKPTRRVWMGFRDLFELSKGNQRGYVKGLRGVGESMYVTTDRGVMEVRECVERKTGGMLLVRVNPM
jgi:ribosomal protein S8